MMVHVPDVCPYCMDPDCGVGSFGCVGSREAEQPHTKTFMERIKEEEKQSPASVREKIKALIEDRIDGLASSVEGYYGQARWGSVYENDDAMNDALDAIHNLEIDTLVNAIMKEVSAQ